MVDFVFARTGWRRVSMLGGTMKNIDLLLEHPFAGERAAVQVKSSADQAVLDGCLAAFKAARLPPLLLLPQPQGARCTSLA